MDITVYAIMPVCMCWLCESITAGMCQLLVIIYNNYASVAAAIGCVWAGGCIPVHCMSLSYNCHRLCTQADLLQTSLTGSTHRHP